MAKTELWETKVVRTLTQDQQADLVRALARGDEPEARRIVGRTRPLTFSNACALEVCVLDTPDCAEAIPLPL